MDVLSDGKGEGASCEGADADGELKKEGGR